MSQRRAPKGPARSLRGFVEVRGPEIISGWAWRAGAEPRTLLIKYNGEVLGELRAADFRADLEGAGIGDGRCGFSWRAPVRPGAAPIDCTDIEVIDSLSGVALADAASVIAIPPPVRGAVEVRGPNTISGWATAWKAPLELVFTRGGHELGRCRADHVRDEISALGLEGGRAGFAWTLPFLDPPVDPGAIEVRDAATDKIVLDAQGVRAMKPPVLRGQIEQRGPDLISGWAWSAKGAPTLTVELNGEALAEVTVSEFRADLKEMGIGAGRAAFTWRVPTPGPPIDCARLVVTDKASGLPVPDAPHLVVVASPRIRGAIEVRGPEVISGWASAWGDPLRLLIRHRDETIGVCSARIPRSEARAMGIEGGKAGFVWRLPFFAPPIDPAEIEVCDEATGERVVDAGGLRPVTPAVVRGQIDQRGPDVISGWAWGPEGAVTLEVRRGDEVLHRLVADEFRPGLKVEKIGGGHAGFRWELPFGDPSFDARHMRVVDAKWGVELADAPGVRAHRRPAVCGVVESRSYRQVAGWAYGGAPGERVRLQMVCDGQPVGECLADQLRDDLVDQGLDDGRHAFAWTPPRKLRSFDASKLVVVAQPSGLELPQVFRAAKPTGLEASRMRMKFGWLHCRLRLTGDVDPPQSIDVVNDGLFLLNTEIGGLSFGSRSWADLAIELPRTINDGRPHHLTLRDHREGDMLAGDDNGLVVQSAFNSMIETVTPHEIRGWVIDPDDPDGEGRIDLYDGARRVKRVRLGRDRREVARAMGASHAWEFVMRRLPLSLFDGQPHALRLACGRHTLAPHGTPRIEVCWSSEQSAVDEERFEGAAQEINAAGVKGYVIDHLDEAPVLLDILVDGEVVGQTLADRYIASLKQGHDHGFYGFDWHFSASLMTGRKRRVAVRVAGRKHLLAPQTRSVAFPLTALGDPPPDLAPPRIATRRLAKAREPALLSLVVLSLNGAHVLEGFLRSVAATTFRDRLEVIVIDHGSTDESRTLIDAYREQLAITPVYRGANRSFSASCNLGAALAKGRYLVMVNNDIEFTGDCLAGMRDLLDAEPTVGLVGLRLLEPRYRGGGLWERTTHHTGVRFHAPAPLTKSEPRIYHPIEIDDGGEEGQVVEPAVTAALAMMRRADFRALGGYDEGYRYGYEDIDFALRMRAQLGKLAVCRLGDSAVHNRSATRESKLVQAPQPALVGGESRTRANLDRFIRRFSRHLPRLILGQLVGGGEAWRGEPLRITFVVGDTERGADTLAARRLGSVLRERFGWEPMLITEDGHDLGLSDILVSLRPGYELRRISEAAPGLVTVAWAWNGPAAWRGRLDAYHLQWTYSAKPAAASSSATAARRNLAGLLAGQRWRVAIKAQAENEPAARALAQAMRRRGCHVRIDGPRHWLCGLAAADELVVAMAGVRDHQPFAGAVNVLCLTAGAEAPTAATQEAFDAVFNPADPDAAAGAFVELYQGLRRESLAGLAD